MTNVLKLLLALVAGFLPSSAQATQSSSDAVTKPREVSYCELAKDPATHNHELVRLTAFVTHGFEDFLLSQPRCASPPENFSVWITYGGNARSDTVYCCPGEGGTKTRPEPLTVQGVQIPLINDRVFQEFTDLLKREPDTTVRVTVVGRFFAGEKHTSDKSTYWQGFGHMGCCSLFVIQEVEWFAPHTRSDVDYTSEAGWYVKEGCKLGSVRDLAHVSISSPDEATERAITEQRSADSGTRAWAFNEPRRVALDSLKPFYKDVSPVLRNVEKNRVRQVFRGRNGKKATVVVMTRPYWLLFYASSDSIAWISTTIKEVECR